MSDAPSFRTVRAAASVELVGIAVSAVFAELTGSQSARVDGSHGGVTVTAAI